LPDKAVMIAAAGLSSPAGRAMMPWFGTAESCYRHQWGLIMTARQTHTALAAALILVGATASAANAATQHRTHAAHSRTGAMNRASSARGGRTSQDNMADQLNAQSLQQSRGGAAPSGAPATAAPGTTPQ